MRLKVFLLLLLLASLLGTAHSFSGRGILTPSSSSSRVHPLKPIQKVATSLPRGGDDYSTMSSSSSSSSSALSSLPIASLAEATAAVTAGLQSGPYGVLALTAVVASVVTPLTLYKRFYGISVAYGFSVGAAGWALLNVFSASTGTASDLLAKACVFYGARLGGYILLRQAVRDDATTMTNGSVMQRISFAASLSFFYAFMTTPALYAMRNPSTSAIAMGGAYVAWFGAILEALADFQKLVVKQQTKKKDNVKDDEKKLFVGPTSLAYRICRHPNYFGEIVFWIGLFVGGAPSFGSSIQAWICSILGVSGILSIMLKATSGLEGRQQEKYGGQDKYENWKKQVPFSLIPFVQ
jgi:steroid 5-alpha reductase family enzyme